MAINMQTGPYFANDYFFTNKALANTGNIESEVFDLGGTQAGLAIQIFANSGATLASTETIKFELLGADTEKGEFTAYKEFTITGALEGTKIVGDGFVPLAEFIPGTDAPKYGKVKITTSSDVSAIKVDGKIGYIAR